MSSTREIAQRVAAHHAVDVEGDCDCEDATMARALVEIAKVHDTEGDAHTALLMIGAILNGTTEGQG